MSPLAEQVNVRSLVHRDGLDTADIADAIGVTEAEVWNALAATDEDGARP